ncbi:MAG: LytTR family transcriptional regulator DNA-binding domain-containing protein [Cyclobacteriaceae bacterium]
MNRIKLVILEDEFIVAEDIKAHLTENGYEVMRIFDNAEDAELYILNNPPDLLLADVQLTGIMTGIELVKKLKQFLTLPVIYITANSDPKTYLDAKVTSPNAFLVKPFTPPNLLTSIDLALYNFSREETPLQIERSKEVLVDFEATIHRCLFIKSKGRYKKICPNDILFVEAAGSYVNVQTLEERFTLTQNLGNFLKKNPMGNILRVHRSYLVNVAKVDSFDESFLFIDGHKLPISESYKEEFMSRVHCL